MAGIFDRNIFDPKIFDCGDEAPVGPTSIGGGCAEGEFVAPDRYTKDLERILMQEEELFELIAAAFMEIKG